MNAIIRFLGLLSSVVALAQPVKGKVTTLEGKPLKGANVYWINTDLGTTTNDLGEFSLTAIDETSKQLVASMQGYITDTLQTSTTVAVWFKLERTMQLSEVVVQKQRDGIFISDLSPIKTEQITQLELTKSACCDLAGCFETQNTVQPQTTNVITNAKELRILGLSGVYNQVLIDGFPLIQGLSFTYGISSIPGTVVDNIYVSKGANSVLQGFESISGQINVETKEPDNNEKLLLNAYTNIFEEKHLNANYTFRVGKWSNITALHIVDPARKIDRDNDNFLDLPLLNRFMVLHKWKYGKEKNWGLHSRIGLRFYNEQRIGGQTFFNPDNNLGSANIYGQVVRINQPELSTKTGYRFNDQHAVTGFASVFYQQQQSYFGAVKYDANQTNLYGNLQYELHYKDHDLKTGASYRHLKLEEDIRLVDINDNAPQRTYDGIYARSEYISGLFVENTFRFFANRLTWITGFRADHHNTFGWQVTPRTLVKYDITPRTIIRVNVGTGWRTVNLFSENINLLASTRDVIFSETLLPERAINAGVNFTQKFEGEQLSGFFSADFYHTNFQNQIFPDYDTNPTQAIIQNFNGTSISNSFQAEVFLKINRRFEFKTGYSFLEVYRKMNQTKQLLPFNPMHKVLTTFSYKPIHNRYHLDMNVHWYGKQRLPNTSNNPIEFRRPDFSSPYTVCNTQFTYLFKRFDFYIGCENIFDFRQLQPIISWQDPSSAFFDTSSVWGPTRGREWYIGLRFRIKSE